MAVLVSNHPICHRRHHRDERMDLFPHQNGSLAFRIDRGVMVRASGHGLVADLAASHFG